MIALYPGDRLERGSVWRYYLHHDLRRALTAARERARAAEPPRVATSAPPAARATPPADEPRAIKSRHHPLGNFVVYRRPEPGDELPEFAALLPGVPVPPAFPDRRVAGRFLPRLRRFGMDPDRLQVARVIGEVVAEAVFRSGLDLPREPEELIELVRREPRIVLPELKAVWQPRYVQSAEGEWVREHVEKAGTVRNAWTRVFLEQLHEHASEVAPVFLENEVRKRVGAPELPVEEHFATATRVAHRAERRLPESWLQHLGMERESLGPDWFALQQKAHAPPLEEEGHWLRAPCEWGKLHVDGQRRRIVELRIDDLAGFMEAFGFRWRFWLVKDSTKVAPRWVLPVGLTCQLA